MDLQKWVLLWLDVNVKGETKVKAQNAKNPYLEEVK